MVLSVPITPGAVEEVKRVMPEARSISGSNAGVLFKPANEAALSLYRMSIPRGDKTSLRLTSAADAEKAFAENKIALNDKINVPGIGATTLGRVRIANSIPEQYRKDVLTNLQTPFDSKYQDKVLKETARGAPGAFIQTADRLAQLGFKMAYESGHSVTLADLEPLKNARDTILASAEKEAEKLGPRARRRRPRRSGSTPRSRSTPPTRSTTRRSRRTSRTWRSPASRRSASSSRASSWLRCSSRTTWAVPPRSR